MKSKHKGRTDRLEIKQNLQNGVIVSCMGAVLLCLGKYGENELIFGIGLVVMMIGFYLAMVHEDKIVRIQQRCAQDKAMIKNLNSRIYELEEEKLRYIVKTVDLTEKLTASQEGAENYRSEVERLRKIEAKILKNQNTERWDEYNAGA